MVLKRSWARQSSGDLGNSPEVWRHRLRSSNRKVRQQAIGDAIDDLVVQVGSVCRPCRCRGDDTINAIANLLTDGYQRRCFMRLCLLMEAQIQRLVK